MKIRFKGQRINFIITMAPKRKGITMIGSPGAGPSAPAQAGDRVATDGAGDVAREHPRPGDRSQASGVVRIRDDEPRAAGSGGGAVLPTGGAAASTAPQLAPVPRPS